MDNNGRRPNCAKKVDPCKQEIPCVFVMWSSSLGGFMRSSPPKLDTLLCNSSSLCSIFWMWTSNSPRADRLDVKNLLFSMKVLPMELLPSDVPGTLHSLQILGHFGVSSGAEKTRSAMRHLIFDAMHRDTRCHAAVVRAGGEICGGDRILDQLICRVLFQVFNRRCMRPHTTSRVPSGDLEQDLTPFCLNEKPLIR